MGSARELAAPGSVDDPRLDPTGERIAFVVGGDLHVREVRGGERQLAAADEPDTFWGLAEFVAAEEMERRRGHWWSPDGTRLAATHVDERDVLVWHIGDPTDPAAAPRPVRYPQAGTANAVVTLWVFDVESGERREIRWDHDGFPYLARVLWEEGGPLALLVQTRDQRTVRLLEADVDSGETALVAEQTDPEWIDLPDQAPTRLSDGRIVTVVADRGADTYRLTVRAEPVTPPGLQVRTVVSAGEGVLFRASEGDPTQIHLWRWMPDDGATRISTSEGVHAGVEGGGRARPHLGDAGRPALDDDRVPQGRAGRA